MRELGAGDADDVEPAQLRPVLVQVHLSHARDLALLRRRNRLERRAEARALSAANLDEYERVTVEGDDIDLAQLAAKVSLDDAVALPAQVISGALLRVFPTSLPLSTQS